jgi:hypothetical protein
MVEHLHLKRLKRNNYNLLFLNRSLAVPVARREAFIQYNCRQKILTIPGYLVTFRKFITKKRKKTTQESNFTSRSKYRTCQQYPVMLRSSEFAFISKRRKRCYSRKRQINIHLDQLIQASTRRQLCLYQCAQNRL